MFESDLTSLFNWAESVHLSLALNKTVLLHLGNNNPHRKYLISGTPLESVNRIKDLGVLITDDLDFEQHCRNLAHKGHFIANSIFSAFQTRSTEFLTQMFKTYVRPTLEYATEVWSPIEIGDIDLIERVQRRFTKRIPSVRHLPYPERLRELDLVSLEERRIKADLIQMFKMSKGMSFLKFDDLFERVSERARLRYPNRVRPQPARNRIRKQCFSVRTVHPWNHLDSELSSSTKLSTFRNKLHCVDFSSFLCGSGVKSPELVQPDSTLPHLS